MKTEKGPNVAPDIRERTYSFALRIVKLVDALPGSITGNVVARQLIRAGMSVGANTEEARGSTTPKEYSRRMSIALSEARETLYWLRIIAEAALIRKQRVAPLMDEADQLVRILTAIVKRARPK